MDWTNGPVKNVARLPLVGGQWRSNTAGGYDLVVVTNEYAPEIPIGDAPEPLVWKPSTVPDPAAGGLPGAQAGR